MNKKINRFYLVTLLLMCVLATGVTLVGCGGHPALDYSVIYVFVEEEHEEKFDAKEFTIEDFNSDNIQRMSYYYRGVRTVNDIGKELTEHRTMRFFELQLKTSDKENAEELIMIVEKLDFVRSAQVKVAKNNSWWK